MMKNPRSRVQRYGLSILTVVLAFFLAYIFRRVGLRFDLSWLFIGVLVLVSWYGGRGPGLVAALLFLFVAAAFSRPSFTFQYLFRQFNVLGLMMLLVILTSARRRAEEKLRARASQQAVIAQLGQLALSARSPLFPLIDKAASLAAQHLEVEYVGIWELPPDGRTLQLRAGIGWEETGPLLIGDGSSSPTKYLLPAREPIIINDLRQESLTVPPLLRDHQVVSGMSVLISSDDQPFGALSAHTTKRRKFTADDLNFLQAMANVLAGAIGQRQAEAEIRKLNEELEQRVVERTAQLEAANKELEAFSYTISHDLRAPLRAINGFSRILLEDFAPTLPGEAQNHLHLVSNNAEQMGQLIDDLLTFSRLSRHPLKKRAVDPASVARQVLQELRAEEQGRRVAISIGELPVCQADPALLKQIFINLLTNALKFTHHREQTVIEIGSRQGDPSGAPIYYVRDNGAGFDMQYVNKLFGVFQRLHRVEEYDGTGVGLAIVQRIVIRHGGRVWAEGKVNQGATFYFTLAGENHD